MNLRHITLHQLRLFNSLGRHLSFTKAAAELHLSQPAVSIQIKRLEENIGLPLVEHLGKKIFLTGVGKELYSATNDIFDRLNTLNDEIIGMEEGIKGSLSLSAITTAKYFMPHFLGIFLRDYPGVKPTLTITNQSNVIRRLKENLDDIVIMGTMPKNLDLKTTYFMDNPLVVVAPADHPLVGKKNIPLERIVKERFLTRESGSGTRAAHKRLFTKHNLEIKSYMELGSGEAIKQAVMAGLGISVLSLHNLRVELDANVISVLDVQHFPLVRRWYAVHPKGKKLSNTSQQFLDFLLESGEQIWQEIQDKTFKFNQD